VTPLPEGYGLTLDRSVRTFRGGRVLVGGSPGRIIMLTTAGADAVSSLVAGEPVSTAARRLGRRLVDAGLAHPRPPAPSGAPPLTRMGAGSVTVVVPVHNRTGALDRCLEALGRDSPVVVVDDGSDDPEGVAGVCRRHGAGLIRRAANGGPAAARNEALAEIRTGLVAFVDSDVRVTPGWIAALVPVFDDPEVGAVAPRIRPDPTPAGAVGPALRAYSEGRSSLDMGPHPGQVGPGAALRYLPAAALVVRREAVGVGFDPRLRVGEDVDLVWRMADRGWRVRYEPSVTVFHHEPSTWAGLMGRRFRYGTSAGDLSGRFPGRLTPVELRPWPTAAVALGLTGRYGGALAVMATSGSLLAYRVRRHGIPPLAALRWTSQAAGWTVVGIGRAATIVAGPVVVAMGLPRGRWRRAAAVLVLAPPLVEWWRRRPGLDPVRWVALSVVDDVAYGAGVWTGSVRARSFGPLIPAVRWSPVPAPDLHPEGARSV